MNTRDRLPRISLTAAGRAPASEMRRLHSLLLFTLMIGCTGHLSSPASDSAENEYAVYSAVLTQLYLIRDSLPAQRHERLERIVVSDETGLDRMAEDAATIENLEPLQGEFLGITRETLLDFSRNAAAAVKLENRFRLPVPVSIVRQNDLDEFFSEPPPDGWERFNARFPNSPGLIMFSRVGFNEEATEALVHVGNQRDWLDGVGRYVYLTREKGGEWRIEGTVETWVS